MPANHGEVFRNRSMASSSKIGCQYHRRKEGNVKPSRSMKQVAGSFGGLYAGISVQHVQPITPANEGDTSYHTVPSHHLFSIQFQAVIHLLQYFDIWTTFSRIFFESCIDCTEPSRRCWKETNPTECQLQCKAFAADGWCLLCVQVGQDRHTQTIVNLSVCFDSVLIVKGKFRRIGARSWLPFPRTSFCLKPKKSTKLWSTRVLDIT